MQNTRRFLMKTAGPTIWNDFPFGVIGTANLPSLKPSCVDIY